MLLTPLIAVSCKKLTHNNDKYLKWDGNLVIFLRKCFQGELIFILIADTSKFPIKYAPMLMQELKVRLKILLFGSAVVGRQSNISNKNLNKTFNANSTIYCIAYIISQLRTGSLDRLLRGATAELFERYNNFKLLKECVNIESHVDIVKCSVNKAIAHLFGSKENLHVLEEKTLKLTQDALLFSSDARNLYKQKHGNFLLSIYTTKILISIAIAIFCIYKRIK
ncbi:uncharacterized protein CMU_023450 [Cryptosporidium muris RN66]|uniref:Uncharacterized protein n=1 Tax=Cryptosporidium muris (strain RN66) TaxID=441375 RepID=B6ABY7_CRYMR|nr:uncharacterized protein CMU_023450 [Cryptosporidium muris RN66]EEA05340.1 hypothetical protein CMU_023450 [Cryptosporidium muris RN66]|eukprot:XP_002139689.1 hypothetical protein [Cryptosporidium muris RN66]